jgi:hypothetical protein
MMMMGSMEAVMMISMNEDWKYLHELLISPVSATHEA